MSVEQPQTIDEYLAHLLQEIERLKRRVAELERAIAATTTNG